MRGSLQMRCGLRATIIGALALALALLFAGCSALRVAYATGPQLAWWWIDGYFDFDSERAPAVKQAIGRWFEWHRATQLPEYVAFLGAAGEQALEPLTPALACRWNAQLRERLAPALDRALVQAAEALPAVGEAQLGHLEQRYRKNLEEMQGEYLQADAAERLQASVRRAIERAEQIYGRLGEAQRKLVAEGVAASPFDPQAWREERRRRQRDTLVTLRGLLASKVDREQRLATLRALLERTERSPDPAYRAYQLKLVDYNCDFVARLHNATTPAQRRKARATFLGWAEDLRAVIGDGGGTANDGPQAN